MVWDKRRRPGCGDAGETRGAGRGAQREERPRRPRAPRPLSQIRGAAGAARGTKEPETVQKTKHPLKSR